MIEVRQTERFGAFRDRSTRARIQARIDGARFGNLGDVKPVGSGVSEMRVDVGPGYRLYFTRRSDPLIVLLCGGDKSSQSKGHPRGDRARGTTLGSTMALKTIGQAGLRSEDYCFQAESTDHPT